MEVPEGAFKYGVTAEDIAAALADTSYEVEAPVDVDCPDALITQPEV